MESADIGDCTHQPVASNRRTGKGSNPPTQIGSGFEVSHRYHAVCF